MWLVRTGTLVMWNIRSSQDYGCMGLVTSLWDSGDCINRLYFLVEWADNTVSEYGSSDIEDENIKVVNF